MFDRNPCEKLVGYDLYDNPIFVPKQVYETDKEAIEAARVMNLKPGRTHKCVAYKCPKCHKWHIGRNGNLLTEKSLKQYSKGR